MAITQKIKKRNGEIADFHPGKITIAVQKAFAAVLGDSHETDSIEISRVVADAIDQKFGNTAFIPSVEDIQDLVEMALMERGYFGVAKSYIIYRYEHSKAREEKRQEVAEKIEENQLTIVKRDNRKEHFSEQKLTRTLIRASEGFERVIDIPSVIGRVRQEMYDGIKTKEIHDVLIMVVRSMIERDPAHSFVAARLLLQHMYREVFGEVKESDKLKEAQRAAFARTIARGVELGQFDPRMLEFDLVALGEVLVLERDRDFKYLGLQTLQANYLSKEHVARALLETPQIFWMRVAMGCALVEKTPQERQRYAIEFYEVMSSMYYTPSSPTLYHAGLALPQLSSCFLSTVPDDLHAIFDEYKDGAQLLKYAGGLGVDWTPVRATGSMIKKTGVESQGVIPFLKIANDVTISINRSGRRRGAAAVYLEYWHLDIEDFLELRKNTGDERRRAHDLNTATWIPDLFMKRLQEDGYWTLFSPSDVPDLHDLYGRAFEEAYCRYEQKAEEGTLPHHKKLRAADLWRKHLTMLFESGHPWITWKDPSNIRSPQDHVGVVHSSNLCTEITLNTSATETAVCNLGSINMSSFVREGIFDRDRVARVVPVAMRMLDNVIDANYYPTEKTKRSNMKHRPVGLGLRGLMDALYKLNINFDSDEAVRFSDESMEAIAYHAILSSALLAKERGTYETYKGSKWDRGIFPQDTLALLEQERGTTIDVPRHETLEWRLVREAVRQWGMRNSNTMANAPTASTANIAGCYPTIEPIYKNIYVKSNMAGDFMIVNEFLVEDLKRLGLWSADMLEKIKFYDGSIQEIMEIPPALRDKYKEAFEIEPQWLIKAAAYRGRWIDQSQSLNIFYGGTSGRILSELYQYAWGLGLKTTYYLRTMGASRVEKSTVNMAKFGSTTKQDGSNSSVASTIIVEERVMMLSQSGIESSRSSINDTTHSVPSPMSVGEVAAIVEAEQVRAGQLDLIELAKKAPAVNSSPATYVSKGIPAFGEKTVVPTLGKVEIVGETCESCSA
ncbi:ribonucleoside-diphosphate reductase subunit alpha [Candidatus Adlerbacteria bacterium RIFCSPLOWO2_01_FULL_54_21b]|uniref:Ribonucleoside-diphosphate reductase n=2 Tax=Candidatus Adleribacteriota TaxID=1752736 RepID=A0A1F4XX94_9BACT|nr:MAG: ribonucleoside-diphosphate reductase subunit alpha [Candidatus Adlerbacteria bacterium RIFCSPLOWO2_01_FULL_54_21b]